MEPLEGEGPILDRGTQPSFGGSAIIFESTFHRACNIVAGSVRFNAVGGEVAGGGDIPPFFRDAPTILTLSGVMGETAPCPSPQHLDEEALSRLVRCLRRCGVDRTVGFSEGGLPSFRGAQVWEAPLVRAHRPGASDLKGVQLVVAELV